MRAWAIAVLGIALGLVQAGAAGAAGGSKRPRYLVDADVCPTPAAGRYDPDGADPYDDAIRAMLMPKRVSGVMFQVVILASFQPPVLVAVEAVDPGSKPPKHQVRVVRGKSDVWAEMMDKMHKQQGSTIHLGDEEQRRALAEVERATETKTARLDKLTVDPLVRAVDGVLERTQYVREVLTAADGSHMIHEVLDGTTFHVWSGRGSAVMTSPGDGSLLGDFTKIAEDLAKLPDVAEPERARSEKAIRDRVSALLARIAKRESCLRPEYGSAGGPAVVKTR